MADHHPDALPDGTAIAIGWERVHELTTEHGTRIVVHVRRGRLAWMRLPAPHADGVVNAAPRDGQWQRLRALWPKGPIDDDPPIVPDGHWARRVVIGLPAVRVRRVRELIDAEVEDVSSLRG